jgi:hypothetical protein
MGTGIFFVSLKKYKIMAQILQHQKMGTMSFYMVNAT